MQPDELYSNTACMDWVNFWNHNHATEVQVLLQCGLSAWFNAMYNDSYLPVPLSCTLGTHHNLVQLIAAVLTSYISLRSRLVEEIELLTNEN